MENMIMTTTPHASAVRRALLHLSPSARYRAYERHLGQVEAEWSRMMDRRVDAMPPSGASERGDRSS